MTGHPVMPESDILDKYEALQAVQLNTAYGTLGTTIVVLALC